MNILLTNIHLIIPGGTETWIKTMSNFLEQNKFNVDIFTPKLGNYGNNLHKNIITDPTKLKSNYDLILCNHYYTTNQIINVKGYKINTMHGIDNAEAPAVHVNRYVTISNELHDYILTKYNFESDIIQNPVVINNNVTFNKSVHNVYSLCHNDILNERLKRICTNHNISFSCNNKFSNDAIIDPTENIRNADVVISIGRGVYESMAEGKGVIVLDDRCYQGLLSDGYLNDKNINDIMYYNCTGRKFRLKPTDNEILDWIYEAPKYAEFLYNYAKDNLAVDKIWNKYLNLAP